MTSFKLTPLLTIAAFLIIGGCSNEKEQPESTTVGEQAQSSEVEETVEPLAPPIAQKHYVYDPVSQTIYEIDLSDDKITERFPAEENLTVIAYDVAAKRLYKGFGMPSPGLQVFDPAAGEIVETFEFPEPISDMLFHPIKRYLYIISEDSTNFKAFNCDSLAIEMDFAVHVIDKGFVGPMRIEPGPSGKLITANGDRASLSQVFTELRHPLVQTVTVKEAERIDYAVFSLDGNASYSVDTRDGALYKIQFGSGEVLGVQGGLDRPRCVQLEVSSNTVVLVVGDATVLMLHPDTFTEMGRVDLSEHGDEILSLDIPPKANFAEVLMDYKGVTRWLRFDIKNWELTRLVELY